MQHSSTAFMKQWMTWFPCSLRFVLIVKDALKDITSFTFWFLLICLLKLFLPSNFSFLIFLVWSVVSTKGLLCQVCGNHHMIFLVLVSCSDFVLLFVAHLRFIFVLTDLTGLDLKGPEHSVPTWKTSHCKCSENLIPNIHVVFSEHE